MSMMITDAERVELLMDLNNYEIALEWLNEHQIPKCRECKEKHEDAKNEYYRKWQYVEWALELTKMYLEDEIAECKKKLHDSDWRMY